jgi:metal-sulfur cluster biosynthetic enzyme
MKKQAIVRALKTVKDPEIDLDVWTMGLIYDLKIKNSDVDILMTYTTPFCPYGPELKENIVNTIKEKTGAKKVEIKVTFDPPYKMPEDLRATLGL